MRSYSRICREPLDSEINAIEARLRKTLRGVRVRGKKGMRFWKPVDYAKKNRRIDLHAGLKVGP